MLSKTQSMACRMDMLGVVLVGGDSYGIMYRLELHYGMVMARVGQECLTKLATQNSQKPPCAFMHFVTRSC
jgi:hypothetical protein